MLANSAIIDRVLTMIEAGSTASQQLKAKALSHALADPLFHTMLSEAADEILSGSRSASNEASVESLFERVLYATLRDIGVAFHPVKEQPIACRLHHKKGRTDSRIGALIIEFKQPSTLASQRDRDRAIAQISDYLTSAATEIDNQAVGFLTDGLYLTEFRAFPDGKITQSAFEPISGDGLLRLTRAITLLDQRALTSENLIKDFCGPAYDGILFQLARAFNAVLLQRSSLKTEMLRTEWLELFRLAHDDTTLQRRIQDRRSVLSNIFQSQISEASMEYQAIFALHTAYAIILKFIAFRVVSDVKFGTQLQDFKSLATANRQSLQAFCAALEDGELFRQIGILNLLEGDFFSWYADQQQWNDEVADAIIAVVQTLARYEDAKSVFDNAKAVDLFRHLYEAAVPQTVRASFGEFYTPFWLAEHVIEASNPGLGWTALDPCCGSGTFVIAALGKIRREEPNITGEEILRRVAGIDLNPLAVLTARIHFFIHIADLIDGLDSVIIPIYLGDASNIPVKQVEDGVEFFHYELTTLKTPLTINLPAKMTDDAVSFAQIMFDFEAHVKTKSYEQAKELLVSAALAAKNHPLVETHVSELADQMIELDRNQWNGIWARIITNFIATARIGPFTNIIGNPPWIDWKSLPSGYRETIKALCIDRGLFSGAGRTGGINLNICALISHVCATNWLSDGGRLAFLMPKELINQSSYEGWRSAVGGQDVALVDLHDWTRAGHPFEPVREDFMTYIFEKGCVQPENIPVSLHVKTERNEKSHLWSDLTNALMHLETKLGVAGQLSTGKTGYTLAANKPELNKFRQIAGHCEYIGREGIEFYPQELMIFKYDGVGPKLGTVWVKNLQVTKSKYRIPQQRILLETMFLFPLAKGPGIKRFHYEDPELYVAFPYEAHAPHIPIARGRLRKISPLLLAHYEKYKKTLLQQTHFSNDIHGSNEYYALARTGPYSFHNCYVAFRDNTKWCATVLTDKLCAWGERKRFLFQNHAVSICERSDKQLIGECEAHFVAGIFNTAIVETYIRESSDNRSFKIRPPIFVPLFEPNDPIHNRISKLSRLASEKNQSDADCLLKEIQIEYLKLVTQRC